MPKEVIFAIVGAFAGCFALLLFSFVVEKAKMIRKVFVFYGINSMIIMGIHSEINFACRFIFDKINFYKGGTALPILIITLLACVPIIIFMNRFTPLLVGRRKKHE